MIWRKLAPATLKGLGNWMIHLLGRHNQYHRWVRILDIMLEWGRGGIYLLSRCDQYHCWVRTVGNCGDGEDRLNGMIKVRWIGMFFLGRRTNEYCWVKLRAFKEILSP